MKKFLLLAAALCTMGMSAQQTLTIYEDATGTDYSLPVFAAFHIGYVKAQMIYPADILTDLQGVNIIGFKFYPQNGLDFEGGELQLSLGTTETTAFISTNGVIENPVTGLTVVATTVPVKNAEILEFTFDTPYKYEGGNLCLQTLVTESGTFGNTCFFGVETDDNVSFEYHETEYQYGGGPVKFLPKMTVVYTQEEPVEPIYYVVGGFNGWSQQEGMVEIGEAGASITVEAQDLNNPDDQNQEFKIITAAQDGGWIWYGGQDANGAGFFGITEELLGQPITLDDGTAPAVQNFRLPAAGTYTIKLVQERNEVEGLKMVVTKETVTAIDNIKSDVKGDNNYYNLMGQKMNGNNLPAGIYIHNGKKVVIK